MFTLMSNTAEYLLRSLSYHYKNGCNEHKLKSGWGGKKNTFRVAFISNALYQHCNRIHGLQLKSLRGAKQRANWIYCAFPKIIFHKVRAPVTCWEVVVHHLRPACSMMDGVRLQTLWGHLIFLSSPFYLFLFLQVSSGASYWDSAI